MKNFIISLILVGVISVVQANPAPAFNLPTRTGKISLSSLQGKVVYLDFWASWCIPCRKSFPWMNEMHKKYHPQGLTVIAINLDKNKALADKFLTTYTANFTIAFDPQGQSADAYNVQGMPSSYLIDKNGNITMTHLGFSQKQKQPLEEKIKQALHLMSD